MKFTETSTGIIAEMTRPEYNSLKEVLRAAYADYTRQAAEADPLTTDYWSMARPLLHSIDIINILRACII